MPATPCRAGSPVSFLEFSCFRPLALSCEVRHNSSEGSMRSRYSVAIVGAGVAGAATAYALTRRGVCDIVLLEREKIAGVHSTGRNAAILRTLIPDPELRRVARESARFYRKPPKGFCSHSLLDPVGIFLLARPEYSKELLACLGNGCEESAPRVTDPAQFYRRLPLLAPSITTVLYQADEGVLDVNAIVQSFLKGACDRGAELRTACDAVDLLTSRQEIVGLETSTGRIESPTVVLAGGGWAADLAARADYSLPLVPYRRHLLITEPDTRVDRRWPIVWILGDEFYFRPESGGLLMCGCDTVAVSTDQGETVDPGEVERIAAKAAHWLPAMATVRVARAWAGMRTFAPDGRFVIGADPRLRGLHWVAALGGHGITCAPVVGEIAAQWITDGKADHPSANALAPGRLVGS